ncbi:TPA: hypothetical protein OMH10_001974 [Enterococcus faecalis]|nr:hypothetical protein [Enterococcus faecalis]
MKIVKQWYFWLAVVFAVLLYQQITSPRELTDTRWLIIILVAINIPLQLFTAYQKSKETKKTSKFC